MLCFPRVNMFSLIFRVAIPIVDVGLVTTFSPSTVKVTVLSDKGPLKFDNTTDKASFSPNTTDKSLPVKVELYFIITYASFETSELI